MTMRPLLDRKSPYVDTSCYLIATALPCQERGPLWSPTRHCYDNEASLRQTRTSCYLIAMALPCQEEGPLWSPTRHCYANEASLRQTITLCRHQLLSDCNITSMSRERGPLWSPTRHCYDNEASLRQTRTSCYLIAMALPCQEEGPLWSPTRHCYDNEASLRQTITLCRHQLLSDCNSTSMSRERTTVVAHTTLL